MIATADHQNEVLTRGRAHALRIAPRLEEAVRPVLDRAGRDAAQAFQERAVSFSAAAARRRDVALAASLPPADRARLVAALALRAAAPDLTPTSTMVALYPRPDEAVALAQAEGEPPPILHVTLAYLGDVPDDALPRVVDAARAVAGYHAPLKGTVAGVGAFQGGDQSPAILLPDVPGLVELRVDVTQALLDAGCDYSHDHGFLAHVTVAYRPDPEPADAAKLGLPLHFDALHVVRGDREVAVLPFVGSPPLTAAAGDPPPWGIPAADELLDVPGLVGRLRTKTDPVRLALIEAVMAPALEAAGLSFDVTNPFAARVLSQAGSQITAIAETTQLNVMRIVREAYEQGLSIPDTAAAIRAGMREASAARATLIARTETAGAVNGGSVAAVQIVAAATDTAYTKRWLTAVGAKYPRHEEYDGLDGQTAPLDGYFDVGGAQLEYPGDPNGPPEEICACRCAVVYDEPGGGETEADGELLSSGGIIEPDEVRVSGGVNGSEPEPVPEPVPEPLVAAGLIPDDDERLHFTVVLPRQRPQPDQFAERAAALLDRAAATLERVAERPQPTPVVNVTVPEQPPAAVVVNVPEQPAPVVNVTVPDQPTPVVNVAAPVVTVEVPDQPSPVVNIEVPVPAVEVHPPSIEVTVEHPQHAVRITRNPDGSMSVVPTEEEDLKA